MFSLPAQTQPENASNSTIEVAKIGPIRRFFKISYVEIIQVITLIVLWAIAARIHTLGVFDFVCPPLFIVILPCLSCIELLSRDELPEVEHPAEASSNSRTVKVTGYRLASTALTLFLAIAKFSLSADNKSAPSNYLDLAGFLVGLILLWIGYYSEAYDTFAPWFFQKDYSSSLGKGLRELGHLCFAGVIAILYYILGDMVDVLQTSSVVRTGDREIRHEDELKLGPFMAVLLCTWPVFLLVEGGLIWGMGSAGRPRPVHSKSTMLSMRTLKATYILIMLWMFLFIWRQSDPQSVMRSQMIYEKLGIKKLFMRTVVTEVVGVKVPEDEV